jgi:hypothetical protein
MLDRRKKKAQEWGRQLAALYGFKPRGNLKWRGLDARRGPGGRVEIVLGPETAWAARGDGVSEGYEVGR